MRRTQTYHLADKHRHTDTQTVTDRQTDRQTELSTSNIEHNNFTLFIETCSLLKYFIAVQHSVYFSAALVTLHYFTLNHRFLTWPK